MAGSFLSRVMNYILKPLDETFENDELRSIPGSSLMKVVIITPRSSEKTCQYADSLRAGTTLIIEYSSVDKQNQQTMHDFLDGVCYVISGSSKALSTSVIMYMPTYVEAISSNNVPETASSRPKFAFDRNISVQQFSPMAKSQ